MKDEMRRKGFDADLPTGFLVYPVSQAADPDAAAVNEALAHGTERGRAAAARTLADVRAAVGLAAYPRRR